MTGMKDDMIRFFIQKFLDIPQEKDSYWNLRFKTDGYIVLTSGICRRIFYRAYESIVGVDIAPIELLIDEHKQFYWDIGKRYCESQEDAIKCSKAAYVLTVVTNAQID